jgi:DNA-binding MarR family transcriptional regulator
MGFSNIKSLEDAIKQTKPFNNAYHKASVNLIYTGKWMIKLHSEIFQTFNLSLQQYNTLRILKGAFPTAVTLKYIKERMLDKMSDASRIIENLHRRKLVKRRLNPNDRRKVDVKITKEGLFILSELDKKNDIMDGFLSNLDEKEIERLNFLLNKVRQ